LALVLAQNVAAQELVAVVQSDLDGNGVLETFTLTNDGDGGADLIIEAPRAIPVYVRNIAWIGGIGQEPTLEVAANGSVLLTSKSESIGRNRWFETLTIAHRRGTYLVAGYTYSFYDTLDLASAGSCDLNLLNRMGFLTRGQGAKEPVAHDVPAIPVYGWHMDREIPKICQLWE